MPFKLQHILCQDLCVGVVDVLCLSLLWIGRWCCSNSSELAAPLLHPQADSWQRGLTANHPASFHQQLVWHPCRTIRKIRRTKVELARFDLVWFHFKIELKQNSSHLFKLQWPVLLSRWKGSGQCWRLNKEEHCRCCEVKRTREREARRRRSEENSARWQASRDQEEKARQEAAESRRRWLDRMRRNESRGRREEEEAAAQRQEEDRRAFERDFSVVFPRTPPPRVVRVGTNTPVSAINATWP